VQSFGTLAAGIASKREAYVWLRFIIDLMVLFAIVYTIQVGQVLTSSHQKNHFLDVLLKIDLTTNCGVPIKKWLYGYSVVYALKAIY
jgi:hypothetical protein